MHSLLVPFVIARIDPAIHRRSDGSWRNRVGPEGRKQCRPRRFYLFTVIAGLDPAIHGSDGPRIIYVSPVHRPGG
jgi:hypothetical protein